MQHAPSSILQTLPHSLHIVSSLGSTYGKIQTSPVSIEMTKTTPVSDVKPLLAQVPSKLTAASIIAVLSEMPFSSMISFWSLWPTPFSSAFHPRPTFDTFVQIF